MTTAERASFVLARAKGLGGSDAASLLQQLVDKDGNPLVPEIKYGCSRKLFLDKTHATPDFEREETGPMRLGNILEPVLCADYEKLTGRRVEVVGQQKHPDFPEMVGHVDRMVYAPEREGPGVLECKAQGTRMFYETKRNGIIPEYLLQVQWYLSVTGARWGSYVIGNRDNLALLYFDVERDEKTCEAFMREAPLFWESLKNPDMIPARLEPDAYACQRCEFRLSCHGSTILPPSEKDDIPIAEELSPLAVEYLERKTLADEAEELVAETKEVVMAILGDRQAVQVPVAGKLRPLYWRPEDGAPLYKEAVTGLSAQYNQMRSALIQIETAAKATGDDRITQLAAGAELIPVPSSFLKKGKQKRPLKMQFLNPAPKKGGE